MLGLEYIWSVMEDIANACLEPPYKVSVEAAHGVGKTHLGAWLANWRYDTRDPGAIITTAPTKTAVCDLLWKEIRVQRLQAKPTGKWAQYLKDHGQENWQLPLDFIGPAAPEMRSSQLHYAKGLVANKGEAFQGRHEIDQTFIFDEAVGLDLIYFTTTKTQFKPKPGHLWILFMNPTDKATPVYQEITREGSGWRRFSISAFDHPNIAKERKGEDPPVPAAVSLAQIREWVNDWCEPILEADAKITDIQWDMEDGHGLRWWRPAPEMESRGLGKWPSQGEYAVWSDALWEAAAGPLDRSRIVWDLTVLPSIGSDTAAEGSDLTEMHAGWGRFSLSHEAHHAWKAPRIQGRLIELARELADACNAVRVERLGHMVEKVTPEEIPIKIDDANEGGAVIDYMQEAGYNTFGIKAGNVAQQEHRYPNKRSELWFSTVRQAAVGLVRFGLLPREVLAKIKLQAMAPHWKQDSRGRREVEQKKVTKEKLGRSPDSMDAINLRYYEIMWEAPSSVETKKETMDERMKARERTERPTRRMFGR